MPPARGIDTDSVFENLTNVWILQGYFDVVERGTRCSEITYTLHLLCVKVGKVLIGQVLSVKVAGKVLACTRGNSTHNGALFVILETTDPFFR